MAAKKISKTRKVTRAKATKKTSIRSSRKAPGTVIKGPIEPGTPIATW